VTLLLCVKRVLPVKRLNPSLEVFDKIAFVSCNILYIILAVFTSPCNSPEDCNTNMKN